MELTVSSWYNEPNINFNISHKVDLYIRGQVIEHIIKPLKLSTTLDNKFLNLSVTTAKSQTKLEVKLGKKWSSKTIHRNHGLWFPYDKVVNSEYPLKEYLNYYMDSLPIIFKEFGVSIDQISKVRQNCSREILHNSLYEIPDEDTENKINEEDELLKKILAEMEEENT